MSKLAFLRQQPDGTWTAVNDLTGRDIGNFDTRIKAVNFVSDMGMFFTMPMDLNEDDYDYRVDTWTGKEIKQGYCINDGERYTECPNTAANYLRSEMGYDGDINDVLDAAYWDDVCYYTEWG